LSASHRRSTSDMSAFFGVGADSSSGLLMRMILMALQSRIQSPEICEAIRPERLNR
jgi:hypothetical protein